MVLTKTHTLILCAAGVFIVYNILEKNPHIQHFLAGKIYTYEVSGQQDSDEVYSEQDSFEVSSEQELEESLKIEEENRRYKFGPWEEGKKGD